MSSANAGCVLLFVSILKNHGTKKALATSINMLPKQAAATTAVNM